MTDRQVDMELEDFQERRMAEWIETATDCPEERRPILIKSLTAARERLQSVSGGFFAGEIRAIDKALAILQETQS